MTLDLILALVGAALTCVIVFFGILHSLGTAHHVLNLEQLGQLGFWASRHECIEPHDVNWQALIFISGMMTMMEELGPHYGHAMVKLLANAVEST